MHRIMLQAKLHRVTTTLSELHYEGSCAIDQDLLGAGGILEYQAIDIYNVSTGARFSTYAISAERGTGTISVNGAAARLAAVGDLLIIAAYSSFGEAELSGYAPRLVYVDSQNRVIGRRQAIPVQMGGRR